MTPDHVPSECPHCHKLGVRLRDVRELDGVEFEWFYCGYCGRNYPPHYQPAQATARDAKDSTR